LNGTEQTAFTACSFVRLDGNGISINGYNRDTSITDCEFAWIGDTAVASWGYADLVDAVRIFITSVAQTCGYGGRLQTAGNFPIGTTITNMLCHEL
jgi:hypothetical protein